MSVVGVVTTFVRVKKNVNYLCKHMRGDHSQRVDRCGNQIECQNRHKKEFECRIVVIEHDSVFELLMSLCPMFVCVGKCGEN